MLQKMLRGKYLKNHILLHFMLQHSGAA